MIERNQRGMESEEADLGEINSCNMVHVFGLHE